MVDTWIDKDERESYQEILRKGEIDAMSLSELEIEFGSLLHTLVAGDITAKERAKKELVIVEKRLITLRKVRDQQQEEEREGKEQIKVTEEEKIKEQRLREHMSIMTRQREIAEMGKVELLEEKERLRQQSRSANKKVSRKAEEELEWLENRLWEILHPAEVLEDEGLSTSQEGGVTEEELTEDVKLEEELLKEKRRLYDLLDNGGEEEAMQAEKELTAVLEKLQAIIVSRSVRRQLQRSEQEEQENLAHLKELEREKQKEALRLEDSKKEEKENKKKKLDEKYLKEAEMRYLAAYKNQTYDALIETSELTGPMTVEIVTTLAGMLQKIDNQRITLDRLIEKRDRLDKEIMAKSGDKGITDRARIIEAFNIKELSQFFKAEKFDVDSDEFKELESSDEEDMPKTRNTQGGTVGGDVKFEHAITYISRLRKSAKEGNIKLKANYNTLARKIEQLTVVQKEIEMTYREKIRPIKKEFDRKLSALQLDLHRAKMERDELKAIMSRGFKATVSRQLLAVEEEIEKVNAAHKLTIEKLTAELNEFKNAAAVPSGDKKRILDLTIENRKLAAKLKEPVQKPDESEKLKEELNIVKKENEALSEKLLEVEVTLEMALEESATHKDTAERVAMAAQNKYNALIVKNDEDLATIKRGLVEPLIHKNGLLMQDLEKAAEEKKQLQEKNNLARHNYKYLEDSVKDLLHERELQVWEKAAKKYIKECAVIETQTEISIPPSEISKADLEDSAAIRFEEDLQGFIDSERDFLKEYRKGDKRGILQRREPVTFAEFREYYTESSDLKEDIEEDKADYLNYKMHFVPFPTPREIERANVCTSQQLLNYRQKKFEIAALALEKAKLEFERKTLDINTVSKSLRVEKEKYEKAARRVPKQLFDYTSLAERLSSLGEEKYKSSTKFFSYPISKWSDKFFETFNCNKFVFLDINRLTLEESKDLFTLLTEINRNTGSKSHIWYGNELNRKFNKRDSIVRPKDKTGLIKRAQDTFLEWLNADAEIGYVDLENDLVTTNSIAYAKLLNTIGNVTVKRSIFTNG